MTYEPKSRAEDRRMNCTQKNDGVRDAVRRCMGYGALAALARAAPPRLRAHRCTTW